jgi:hypothetical protein
VNVSRPREIQPHADDDLTSEQTGMSPARRRRRARIAGHASWANTADRAARTAAGTKAFLERFERQVDPNNVLPADVRRTMAIHARTAYVLQLAQRSAAAGRRRAAE